MKKGDIVNGMEVLDVRYTRPDRFTQAGGLILMRNPNKFGDDKDEFIAWSFTRPRGSLHPRSFFWGRYHRTEEEGRLAFNDKLDTARTWDTGGSLIPEYDLSRELQKESLSLATEDE
jgi:hypothetical protein